MSIDIKPNHKPIKEYYEELASFEKHGHSNEIVNGLPKDGFGERGK